jgi:hypothetical protein
MAQTSTKTMRISALLVTLLVAGCATEPYTFVPSIGPSRDARIAEPRWIKECKSTYRLSPHTREFDDCLGTVMMTEQVTGKRVDHNHVMVTCRRPDGVVIIMDVVDCEKVGGTKQ